MFGVLGGVAGGIGSSNLSAAPPPEGLLVRDDGGSGGGGGYCHETWRWANGAFALTISCTDGTHLSKFIGGGF